MSLLPTEHAAELQIFSWYAMWIRMCERSPMQEDDPELPRVLTDERKTVDLCQHERDGARCIRKRGHDGQHESLAWNRAEPLRWE